MSESPTRPRPDVELRLPADSAYAAVLRSTAAGLAARLDFTIDDIEDLRIAVGEAHALVLDRADEGAHLECGFVLRPGAMTVSIGVPATGAPDIDRDAFGWQVLTTLAASVDAGTSEGYLSVVLALGSSVVPAGGVAD